MHIKFHKSVKIEYRENTLKTLYLYKATLRSLTVQYEIFTQEPPIPIIRLKHHEAQKI